MKNNSVLQQILTSLFAVLVLAASNSIVRAQGSPPSTNWSASRADWFNCNNWSGVCPNPLVDAHINNGGQAQIRGGLNHAAAYSLTVGDNQGDSGSLLIDTNHSAVLDIGDSCRGNIYIGHGGSGTLTIKDDGYIRSRYGYVAALQNSSGNVTVQGNGTTWYLYDVYDEPECLGAGLFIGCTADSNGVGGTATVNVSNGAKIEVSNRADAPGVKVGVSGTLKGGGLVAIGPPSGNTALSKTAEVYGTLAPTGALEIRGNLDLKPQANTVCHVTPQGGDNVQVTQLTGGGNAFLGGRLTVIMTGTFTDGMSFTLLHSAISLHATEFQFESIISPGGDPCMSPVINYDSNDVKLVVQSSCFDEPEP